MKNIKINEYQNGASAKYKKNAEDYTDRHTEDMQEIITKVPAWILRWGITLFFGILLMALSVSIFVRYPDSIKASLKIESSDDPIPVFTNGQGRISKLFVKRGAIVKRGQILASVEIVGDSVYSNTLTAPQNGKVGFVAIVQEGCYLKANQNVFNIHPEVEHFFGVIMMPQNNINKVREGQEVLIDLKNYPSEEYGRLKGKISYIADEPVKEGFFNLKVSFNKDDTGLKKPITLKNWMTGDAEIITENISLQSRIYKAILKGL